MITVTAIALYYTKAYPYIFTGWLWFLVTLFPVIGIVQVGAQAMADRYTYIPLIGLYVAITWAAADFGRHRRFVRLFFGSLAVVVLAGLIHVTRNQIGYWKNSESLFQRAIAVTHDNYVAHKHLADALVKKGRNKEAIRHYADAIRIKPDYVPAYVNISRALAAQGRMKKAEAELLKGLKAVPDSADLLNGFGVIMAWEGQLDRAIVYFSRAVRSNPNMADAHNNLGLALVKQGRIEEGLRHYEEALRIDPGSAETHFNMANALVGQWRFREAALHYRQVLRIRPNDRKSAARLRKVEDIMRTGQMDTETGKQIP